MKRKLCKRVFSVGNWWTNPINKQQLQPHVIIQLPFKYRPNATEKIIKYYQDGLSLREIQRRGGGSKTKIRQTLIETGVEIRSFDKDSPIKPDLAKVMRSGATPYGFCYLDGKLVLDNREQQVIHRILEMVANGVSYRGIAKALNEQNVRTRFGKIWRHEVVKQVYIRNKEKP